MWMHKPGYFASQGTFYTEEPVENYLNNHRLKFWSNPNWTKDERDKIIEEILIWLSKPKFSTRYDFIAILGQLLGIGGLLQNPFTKICSDYGSFLKVVDPNYDLKHPAPDQVNEWFIKNSDRYEVYGKYVRD